MKIGERTKIWHKHLSNFGDCVVGNDCTIHSHVWIGDGVIIGDNTKIQAFTFIPTGVKIGDNVFIGPRVTFTNDKYPPGDWSDTMVRPGVSIGAGAVILPGIILWDNCRIGAGAVVTKDVPPGQTWVGNPAKPIKKGKPITHREIYPEE